ncbi:MAG TPA: hypothetical protein VJH89_01025, partial [Patescibacteria group bacterium]|nr:hypothetical protein [Patescibacteria group bacterium]
MSIAFGIVVLLFWGTVVFFVLFIISIARGAPYVTTNKEYIKTILAFANPNPNERVADLGSGDG